MRSLCPRKADPVYLKSPLTVFHRLGNQVEIKAQTGKVYRRPLSHLKIVPPPSAVRDANTFRDTLDRKKFRDTVLTRICASLGLRMKFKTLCYPVFGRNNFYY